MLNLEYVWLIKIVAIISLMLLNNSLVLQTKYDTSWLPLCHSFCLHSQIIIVNIVQLYFVLFLPPSKINSFKSVSIAESLSIC